MASGLCSPMTVFTNAGSASMPNAASEARNDSFTASPSKTVVPAMSKTTSSITVFLPVSAGRLPACPTRETGWEPVLRCQPLRDELFRHAEGHRHARTADAGHRERFWGGPREYVRGRRVLHVHPVPPRRDRQVGDRDEAAQIAEDQVIHVRFVERLD